MNGENEQTTNQPANTTIAPATGVTLLPLGTVAKVQAGPNMQSLVLAWLQAQPHGAYTTRQIMAGVGRAVGKGHVVMLACNKLATATPPLLQQGTVAGYNGKVWQLVTAPAPVATKGKGRKGK